MNDLKIWEFLYFRKNKNENTALLCVVDNKGSSPGKRGFKMAVSETGEICGSVGGGIMEFNLIEKLKVDLKSKDNKNYLLRQVHRANAGNQKSGMICSGEETIAVHFIVPTDLETINKIINSYSEKNDCGITISDNGLDFKPVISKSFTSSFNQNEVNNSWDYTEKIGLIDTVYIIGGGHVGLGLSKVLSILDFNLVIIDDRNNLNTLEDNHYVNHKIIAPYEEINHHIIEGENSYIVIMTFGYNDDFRAVKAIIDFDYKYIGLMGSKAKIKTLLNNLRKEGYTEEKINKLHTPIGLPINSRTPEEIGISVAAEIIKIKNSG